MEGPVSAPRLVRPMRRRFGLGRDQSRADQAFICGNSERNGPKSPMVATVKPLLRPDMYTNGCRPMCRSQSNQRNYLKI
jgi:hypothetical protein